MIQKQLALLSRRQIVGSSHPLEWLHVQGLQLDLKSVRLPPSA